MPDDRAIRFLLSSLDPNHAAKYIIKESFNISDGWKENTPKFIQRVAPFNPCPKPGMNIIIISANEPTRTNNEIFFQNL